MLDMVLCLHKTIWFNIPILECARQLMGTRAAPNKDLGTESLKNFPSRQHFTHFVRGDAGGIECHRENHWGGFLEACIWFSLDFTSCTSFST